LRVTAEEQDLTSQAEIVQSTRTSGFYVAGVYREINTVLWGRSFPCSTSTIVTSRISKSFEPRLVVEEAIAFRDPAMDEIILAKSSGQFTSGSAILKKRRKQEH
jgi:hypothetical protein